MSIRLEISLKLALVIEAKMLLFLLSILLFNEVVVRLGLTKLAYTPVFILL
jgi:hypothetical protein